VSAGHGATGFRSPRTDEAGVVIDGLDQRQQFAITPTPLMEAPRLAEAFGTSRRILIKRDDLTGPGLGGNKVRKLEFLIEAALRAGADTLVTVGGVQSNHARLTAILGGLAGLHVELLLEAEEAPSALEGNLLLEQIAGAAIHFVQVSGWDELHDALEVRAAELKQAERRPFVIPLGGSTEVGVLGYVRCYYELMAQLDARGESCDWIVHASSSGGTQAGLVLGRRLSGRSRPRVYGVDVIKAGAELLPSVAELAERAARRLRAPLRLTSDDLHSVDFTGPAYAELTSDAIESIGVAARTEALVLDPVYTSKAMAGLRHLLAHDLDGDGPVIFIHTGGHPALFASHYARALTGTSS
jgi:D-cysteine desulfhydrase family pyridoxal phosphate-dependent enzyme